MQASWDRSNQHSSRRFSASIAVTQIALRNHLRNPQLIQLRIEHYLLTILSMLLILTVTPVAATTTMVFLQAAIVATQWTLWFYQLIRKHSRIRRIKLILIPDRTHHLSQNCNRLTVDHFKIIQSTQMDNNHYNNSTNSNMKASRQLLDMDKMVIALRVECQA